MDCGTHLHVASGYSARYGASHPRDLVQRAAERGTGTLALTDRDTVTGAVRFAKACRAAGVRPVFGVDVAVAPWTPQRPSPSRPRTPARGGAHVVEPPLRVTLLARDATGWGRLCRVVSAAHAAAAGNPPVVSWDVLRRYAGEGLVVLLGPVSEPVRALSAGPPDLAERLIAPWREVAGTNLRLETVWWGLPGTGPGSLRLAARTLGLAARLGVPAVLTNAVSSTTADKHLGPTVRVPQAECADVLGRDVGRRNPGTLGVHGGFVLQGTPQDAVAHALGRLAGAHAEVVQRRGVTARVNHRQHSRDEPSTLDAPQPPFLRLLEMTGTDALFPITDT